MEDAGSYTNPDNLSRKIVDVAAGESHTLLLTGDGNVYTWGKGMFGRLGLGSQKDELSPIKLNFQNPNGTLGVDSVKIVGIAAGAYHSLALAGAYKWGIPSLNSGPCILQCLYQLSYAHSDIG
ncbi:E3 ubiquitin-protein ligase herc2-like protein [Trifolium pratense]|uniref:E3 ubiquitin-protein ligase herc2-like protein n=1 Tax=Trifolium pratense TaxID=57577 RepID=A0A2K3N5M7_TRIPR|nr:E3 ubiquitin-protein ligase herc2-like protein [Trifolium pratense]